MAAGSIERRIITSAPPGNDPGESRQHEVAKCLPSREGKPHVWDTQIDGFGEPTGKMYCMWCKKTAPMKKFLGMSFQLPVCSKTGY